MTDIKNLEPAINRNVDEAIQTLREIIDKRMTSDEKKQLIGDREKKVDDERLKQAQANLPDIGKVDTAEDKEKVAKNLKAQAKAQRDASMTPQQKAVAAAKKKADAAERFYNQS